MKENAKRQMPHVVFAGSDVMIQLTDWAIWKPYRTKDHLMFRNGVRRGGRVEFEAGAYKVSAKISDVY